MTGHPRNTLTGLPPEPSYYTILSLPRDLLLSTPSPKEAAALVRKAYRRALLQHHPDKQPHHPGIDSGSSPQFPTQTTTKPGHSYSIDQITHAHTTLSSPSARAEYNRKLTLSRHPPHSLDTPPTSTAAEEEVHLTGLDTIDLDEMTYVPAASQAPQAPSPSLSPPSTALAPAAETVDTWTRPCRCGNPTGYELTEMDLEDALGGGGEEEVDDGIPGQKQQQQRGGKLGEILVPCKDCSLWLRVLFQDLDE